MGPRANEIHVAAHNVRELRKLIEMELPEPPPDPGDPVAIVADPLGRLLAGGAHGTKLDQLETLPAQAEALLNEKHRSTGIQLDRQRDQQEEGRQANQPDQGHEKAHRTREREVDPGLPEVSGEDEVVRCQRLDGELSREALVDLDAVLDHDSERPRLEKLANGQPPPPFGGRNDDAVGPDLVNDRAELLEWGRRE